MSNFRASLGPGVPTSAKIFGWVLALVGLFFAYVFSQDPGNFFPGVSITTYSEQFGLYSTSIRVLGSVFGIVVALLLNSAALLALMLATRVFIEIGDVIVGLIINGAPDANTFTLTTVAAAEIFFIILLLRVLKGTEIPK